MTDEDFLKLLAPEINPDRALFDPAVDRDKTVFRTGVVLLKKMGYLSENGEQIRWAD